MTTRLVLVGIPRFARNLMHATAENLGSSVFI